MRDRREVLKLLSAKTSSWNPNRTQGGSPSLTWEDVAGALSHLDTPARVYAQIKYQTPGSTTELHDMVDRQQWLAEYALMTFTAPLSVKEDWASSGNSVLERITTVALEESIESKTRHRKCGGRGWLIENDKVEKCTCDDGFIPFSFAEIARRISMDRQYFTKSAWRDRYVRVLHYFYDLDNQIIKVLDENL